VAATSGAESRDGEGRDGSSPAPVPALRVQMNTPVV
jgi:hypothetical protein